MSAAAVLLAFVTLERLAELWLAQRNTRALLRRGAYEVAAGHYGLIVALHACWLAGLWWLGSSQPVQAFWLIVFLLLQALRVWVLFTLGSRWTTRIIILPGEPLIAEGPYRFIQHPNYVVVVGEIASLPLALGLSWFAAIFSVANAIVLTVRIRAENAALRTIDHGA